MRSHADPANDTSDTGSSWASIHWLAPVLVLGGALFLHDIDGKSLSISELHLLNLANGEREMWSSAGNALGYLPIVRSVASWSSSETALRLPAGFFAIIGLWLTYLAASRLFGRVSFGLATALFLAVSPFYVAQAQLVHSYSAFCAAAVASLYLLWTAYHQRSPLAWASWMVCLGLAMWLHFYIVFVLAAELAMLACWMLADRRLLFRRPTRAQLGYGLLVALVVGFLMTPLLADWVVPLGGQWLGKLQGHEPAERTFSPSARFDPSAPAVYLNTLKRMLVGSAQLPKLWPILLALAGLGALMTVRRRPRVGYSLLIWLLLPLGPIVVFAYFSGLDFGARRLIFALPVICMLWAAGLEAVSDGLVFLLTKLRKRLSQVELGKILFAGSSIVLAGLIASVALDFYYRHQENADYRAAGRIIELYAQPQDLVYSSRIDMMRHYFQGPGALAGNVPRSTEAVKQGSRIWYVRPTSLSHAAELQTLEPVMTEAGAHSFAVGGGLELVVLIPEADAKLLSYLKIAVSLSALKGERTYCLEGLARVHEALGDQAAGQRERQRIQSILRRDRLLKLFQ